MQALEQVFQDRLSEIEAYLDLLSAIEAQVQKGPPRLGDDGTIISPVQQKILYSSVYLQLYNLIEATITKCVDAVSAAIAKDDAWQPSDLSVELRKEWVRFLARTHTDLNYEKRLKHSLALCEHLIRTLPVGTMQIEKGGGGNWDDVEIHRFAIRLGCALEISGESMAGVKRPFRNEKGALALIVKLRNDLAHGNVSFVECGDDVTVDQLRDLKSRTAAYLKEVVHSFRMFVSGYSFLVPERRPAEDPA